MKKHTFTAGIGVLLSGLAACGPAPVAYYKVAFSTNPTVTGTDCPSAPTDAMTFSGIDNADTVAIYAQPNNKYVIDLGAVPALNMGTGVPVELSGTFSNNAYSFSGDYTQNNQGTPDVTTGVSISMTLTPNGPGFTGSVAYVFSCTTTGTLGCGIGNPLATYGFASSDGKNFSCNAGGQLTGSEIPNTTENPATNPGVGQ